MHIDAVAQVVVVVLGLDLREHRADGAYVSMSSWNWEGRGVTYDG